jgi:hypothetical protein
MQQANLQELRAQQVSTFRSPSMSRLQADQANFSQVLNTAQRALDTNEAQREQQTKSDETRKAAQDFVSIAFVQPVLKQLRESSQAAAPFAATSAQKSFQQMLDGVLARKITQGTNWPLVDAVEQRMLRKAGTSVPHMGLDPAAIAAQTPRL